MPVAQPPRTAPTVGHGTGAAASPRLGHDGGAGAKIPDPVARADVVGMARHASALRGSAKGSGGDPRTPGLAPETGLVFLPFIGQTTGLLTT